VQLDGRSIADWERYRDDCLMTPVPSAAKVLMSVMKFMLS
jgi:hypothetical protein